MYLMNRTTTRTLHLQMPYESFKGRKPNIDHLKVYGCIGYARFDKPYLKKLDDKSCALVHLGTVSGSKAYRLLDPATMRIVVSRNVVFDEDRSWKWSDADSKEDTEHVLISFGYREPKDSNSQTKEKSEIRDEGINHEVKEEKKKRVVEEETSIPLRRSSRTIKKPSYLNDYELLCEEDTNEEWCDDECQCLLMLVNEEPSNYEEVKDLKVWRDACEDEINSIVKNNTWTLVELPANYLKQ